MRLLTPGWSKLLAPLPKRIEIALADYDRRRGSRRSARVGRKAEEHIGKAVGVATALLKRAPRWIWR